VVFEPKAIAYDPQPLEREKEVGRKLRTLGGNYQMAFRYPAWVLPWGHPLWWRIVSHKYLRLVAPWALAGAWAGATVLAPGSPACAAIAAAGGLLLAAGLLGIGWGRGAPKLFAVPAGFIFLNWMALRALGWYLARRRSAGW
jgi:hypothetical protein